jgi:competence protein ComGC
MSKRQDFTLIDLLVVIAVLLIVLFLPALQDIRNTVYEVKWEISGYMYFHS